MYDSIVKVFNSQVQHGSMNDRIYLMHIAKEDMPVILENVRNIAIKYQYSKIFAKVPDPLSKEFLKEGYVIEASIPGFFHGKEDGMFMSKYLKEERKVPVDLALNKKVLDAARFYQGKECALQSESDQLDEGFTFKIAKPVDAPQMAKLYDQVFDSYPFPITEPNYIQDSMKDDVIYFSIWNGDKMVALSSCEMSRQDQSVEMTDFAVLPEYRGNKFSSFLLMKMEKTMKENHIKTAYTIARSNSYGMNITFSKCGYYFSGTLIQNTQIAGKIEDMNVWYKSL